MAFTRVDQWETSSNATDRITFVGSLAAQLGLDRGAAATFGRRLGSLLASALVHGLLLYLLATRLLGDGGRIAGSGSEGKAITLIALSGPAQERPETADPQREARAAAVAEPASSNTEQSAPAQPVKPEWTTVRMLVARPFASAAGSSSASAAAKSHNATPAAAAGGSRSGGGNYDPYAGAAPQRLEGGWTGHDIFRVPASRATPVPGGDSLVLDAAVLEAVRRSVLEADARAAGTAEIVVRVASDGEVLKARIVGGTVSRRLHRTIRKLLVGKRLFKPQGELSGRPLKTFQLVLG